MNVEAAPETLLPELIATWAKVRHHRLAHLVDRVAERVAQVASRPALAASKKKADLTAWLEVAAANDPADFDRLAAAMRGGSQDDVRDHVVTLAERGDPRLGRALLALLEKPPYAGVKSRALLAVILDALAATGDRRAAEPARELSGRYLGIVSSGTGGWVVTRLAQVADELDAIVEPDLGELATECDALEQRFGKPAAIADDRRTLAELLAEVYAAPADDAPRLVYADALLERGDLRGEHITLQITKARGTLNADGAARLSELEADPKRMAAWAQPLSNGGQCKIERGFPVAIVLYRTAKAIEDSPALATLEHVGAAGVPPQRTALAILDAPNVRRVTGCPAALLDKACARPRPWTHLGVEGTPSARALAAVPALVELELVAKGSLDELAVALAGLRLRKLRLKVREPAPSFVLPATLETLELDSNELPVVDFTELRSLVTLRLEYLEPPDQVTLPASLRELTLRSRTRDRSLPTIRGARGVTTLSISDVADLGAGLAGFTSLEHLKLDMRGELRTGAFASLGQLHTLELAARDAAPDVFGPLVSLRELVLRLPFTAPPRFPGVRLERLIAPYLDAAQLTDPLPQLRRAQVTTTELAAVAPFLARYPKLEQLTLGIVRQVADQPWADAMRALAASRVARFRLEYGGSYQGHDWVELERDGDGSLRMRSSGATPVTDAIALAVSAQP